MSKYLIGLADEAALPACLALLPEIASPEAVVLAARDADGRLAGAAGVVWNASGQPAGMPAWVRVLPDCRARGVGAALVARLGALTAGEADRLWSARQLEVGGTEATFATAVGCTPGHAQLYFDADGPTFLAHMTSIVDRMRARGRIPASARTIEPAPRMHAALIGLIRSELRGAPPQLEALLRRVEAEPSAVDAIDLGRSRVLLVDDAIVGVLLSARQGDGRDSKIICNVVAPEYRRGWANVLLLQETTRAGVAGGCRRFAFDCAEDNRDTIGLAERGGARHVRTSAYFAYAVASAP